MKKILAIVAIGATAACGGSSSAPSVVTPTTAPPIIETFTGTVQPAVNGQAVFDSHNFMVTDASGVLTVTLTAAGPPPTIKIGVGVGSPNTSGACVLLSSTSWQEVAASTTPALQGSLASTGTYCVTLWDTGNVLQPVAYSVTVSHT